MSHALKIIVADDELDTREYLEEFVAHLGHDVRAVADGGQLAAVCLAFRPDIILTDYAMPIMNGLAAVTEVNRNRYVPVILISGRDEAAALPLAPESPVVKFLAKPVRNEQLKAAIDSVAAEYIRH